MKIIISRAVLQQRAWALGLPRIRRNEALGEGCFSLYKGGFCLRNLLTGSHALTVRTTELSPARASNVPSSAFWQLPGRHGGRGCVTWVPQETDAKKPTTNMVAWGPPRPALQYDCRQILKKQACEGSGNGPEDKEQMRQSHQICANWVRQQESEVSDLRWLHPSPARLNRQALQPARRALGTARPSTGSWWEGLIPLGSRMWVSHSAPSWDEPWASAVRRWGLPSVSQSPLTGLWLSPGCGRLRTLGPGSPAPHSGRGVYAWRGV